jgi:hypothetical protein
MCNAIELEAKFKLVRIRRVVRLLAANPRHPGVRRVATTPTEPT